MLYFPPHGSIKYDAKSSELVKTFRFGADKCEKEKAVGDSQLPGGYYHIENATVT